MPVGSEGLINKARKYGDWLNSQHRRKEAALKRGNGGSFVPNAGIVTKRSFVALLDTVL